MAARPSIQYACLTVVCICLAAACTASPPQSEIVSTAISATITPQSITLTDEPTETANATATREPTPPPAAPHTSTPDPNSALVLRVLDGDTIEVMVSGATHRLRYIGIDSPEDGQPFSAEAETMNRELVEGKKVVLEVDISETDRYDRLLRYVYLLDGTFVNAELVRAGYARAAAYEPDTRYQGYFEEMQAAAQTEGLGIWGQPEPTATLPVVDGGILIDPGCSQFNAPGNDNENKNEEFVCVVNLGAAGIDLSSWALHDAYGWRYTFPAFSLQSGGSVLVRTGCGEDTGQDLHWCKDETAVWNNDGDCAHLLDAAGELVHQYCY